LADFRHVLDAKGDWYYCDDAEVTKTTLQEDHFESASAYLLFYF